MPTANNPLWQCPKCGQKFVTVNSWHSCGRYDLEAHFTGRNSLVRDTFDRLVALGESFGPLTVYPQKTRIVFMVRVRFAGVMTRKNWLIFSLWLTHKSSHPKLQRVETYGPRSYGLQFKLTHPDDIDDELQALFREAYLVGRQEHLP